MLRTALAFAAFVGLLASANAAPPSPKADPNPKSLEVSPDELLKARELVQKLGSDAFTERESAERELYTMGRLARPALLDGGNIDPDPEIRARCNSLLPKANAEEFQARLDTFLADTEGKYEHNLPGWRQLRAVVRGEVTMFGWTHVARPETDKVARELFIEFLKISHGQKLLATFGGPPEHLGLMVANLKQELYNARYRRVSNVQPRTVSAMEIALVMFAESQVPSRHAARNSNVSVLYSLATQSNLTSLTNGSDAKAKALQAVLGAWFDSRTEPMEQYYALLLANNMRNDAAAGRLAARVLANTGLQGSLKSQALTTIVRLKAVDQLPMIEKCFTDETVIANFAKQVNGKLVRETIEVRDAALVAALLITGQEPSDYGFEGHPKGTGANFSTQWAKIPDDKRKAAFEKWKEWKEKNP